MPLPARARGSFATFSLSLALAAGAAACSAPPPAPLPAPPWLVEVASIDASAEGAGLIRCGGTTCEHIDRGAVLAGSDKLRADRGARVVLALGADTELTFRDGAEIELTHSPERLIRVLRGTARVERRESAPRDALPVVLEAQGHRLVVRDAPAVVRATARTAARTGEAMVRRGHATLRAGTEERLLATGEGAIWKAGEPPLPTARWLVGGDDTDLDASPRWTGSAPRGLGTMTARVPGTNDVVSGVRLALHHVRAEVHDGFARTVVEEEFENETSRTLEGRFVFPLPPDASISRLALWVGDDLVEGEIVERPLASRIFRAIVDDTVRPRDPALLEQGEGSTVSLKIFPIPPKGRRRVLLAYDQSLSEQGDRVRYVYPLSLGADRATPVADFALSVVVRDTSAVLGSVACPSHDATISAADDAILASYSAKDHTPSTDFVLAYNRKDPAAASLAWSPGPKAVAARETDAHEPPAGYFALRLRAGAAGLPPPAAPARSRAFVLDVSHSQSPETLDASIRVVRAALANLDPEDRFVLLACDSACDSYPESGLARAGDAALADAAAWMTGRTTAGSSDLAGALLTAADRLTSEGGGGQLVYLGDGVPTSGELTLADLTERLAPALRGLDAHLVGVGPSIDEPALSALAASLSGTYERLANGDSPAQRAAEIARTLDAPVLRDAALVLPDGAFDTFPEKLPPLRLGQELRVVGRFRPRPADPVAAAEPATVPAAFDPTAEHPARGPLGEVRLTGKVAGHPYEQVAALDWNGALASPSPAVHAIWARARIAALELTAAPDSAKEIVRLSTVHHVLSRATALLVLENERMFVDTGVRAAIDRVLAQPAPPASTSAPSSGQLTQRAPSAGSSSPGTGTGFGMMGALSGSTGSADSPWGKIGVLGSD
ncbi:MAG: VIT and VWA domain-containing protein, partial [Polyangiaceae bacterium]